MTEARYLSLRLASCFCNSCTGLPSTHNLMAVSSYPSEDLLDFLTESFSECSFLCLCPEGVSLCFALAFQQSQFMSTFAPILNLVCIELQLKVYFSSSKSEHLYFWVLFMGNLHSVFLCNVFFKTFVSLFLGLLFHFIQPHVCFLSGTCCFVITAMVISLEIRISYLQHYIYCAGLLCLEICAPILILEFCYD